MPAPATYAGQRDAFGRSVQWVVEITLPRCQNIYTQDNAADTLCEASDLGDGNRCHYTFGTCQDPVNFELNNALATSAGRPPTRVLRFCMNLPAWTDEATVVWPLIRKFVAVPQEIHPAKLFTYPEKIKVTFLFDHNPPPIDHDRGAGFHNTQRQGEFWINLVARNRNYPGRVMKVFRGFAGIPFSEFLQVGPDYTLTQIDFTNKRQTCTITAESPMKILNTKRCPWVQSEDNVILNVGGISAGATSMTVRHGEEFPNPTDFSRNVLYVKVDLEIIRYTALVEATGVMTIERGALNTTAVAHLAGAKVRNLAYFGKENLNGPGLPKNVIDVIQDLMEWATILAADVDTASFDDVRDNIWAADDTLRQVTKSEKISRLLAPLRELRGLMVYMDGATQKWTCRAVAPTVVFQQELTDDNVLLDTNESDEDEESRITRVSFWYDPITDNPGKEPKDYQRSVIGIDATLEQENNFGESKDQAVFDPWTDPGLAASRLRNSARRIITRLRSGVRTFSFDLEVKDADLNVGQPIKFTCPFVRQPDGITLALCTAIVYSKKEKSPEITSYKAVDVNPSEGRYMRITSDTAAEPYDTATDKEKSEGGYWGDVDNRVGAAKEEGYLFY